MQPVTEDLQRFWSSLACLLEEGRLLLSALREAAGECVSPEASSAVAAIAEMVAAGAALSDALAARSDFFGPGAVCIIRGGEHLGMVARAARFVADASEQCPGCAAWRGESRKWHSTEESL